MPKGRRRSFTPQFKAQVVLEVLSGRSSASEAIYHGAAPAVEEVRLRRALGRLAARWPT